MKGFLALLKANGLSLLGINQRLHSKNKSSVYGGATLSAVITLFCCAMAYVYALMIIDMTAMSGIVNPFPVLTGFIVFISFFLSFYSVGAMLFGTKDYDQLASMPIKTPYIVISKILATYLLDIAINVVFMVASLIAYSKISPISALFIIDLLIMSLFAPMFSIAFGILIGTVINMISARLRRKTLVQIIAFTVVFGAYFVVAIVGGNIFVSISKLFFLSPIFEKGLTNVLYMLLFNVICVAMFLAIVFLTCIFYHPINSFMKVQISSKKKTKYHGEEQSCFSSLIKKEFKCLFGNSIYFMNTIFFPILFLIIGGIMLFVVGEDLTVGLTEIGISKWQLVAFMPAMFIFMFMTAPVTAPSISIEGNSLWVLTTSPVSGKTVFKVKLTVHNICYCTAAVLFALLFSLFLSLPFYMSLLLILTAIAISLFSGVLGLLFNILFPKLNWTNKTQAIKQGMAVFLCVIVSFVLSGITAFSGYKTFVATAFFGIATSLELINSLYLIIISLVFLIATAILYNYIVNKGEDLLFTRIK
ncbi:MAG: hypothetical protein IJR66_04410 [Clostridia bacterium]|nr:hypothetical protein [Clostridia bacterium]